MPRLVTSPEVSTPTGTYSPGIVSGGHVYIAGQGPFDALRVPRVARVRSPDQRGVRRRAPH